MNHFFWELLNPFLITFKLFQFFIIVESITLLAISQL